MLDRAHNPPGLSLDHRANLSRSSVTRFSVTLAVPESDTEGVSRVAVSKNEVSDVPRLGADCRMDDLAHDPRNVTDSIGSGVQKIHPREHMTSPALLA